MTVKYEGQNLKTRWTIAIGYFKMFLDFSLKKEYATRNPPKKKKTSTAKNAATTNKKNQF